MSYVGKITDTSGNTGLVGSTLYGTCSTGASTAAKVVTCADFDKLITGVTIHVKFSYSNTAANPTLNVNSTGAKNIYYAAGTSGGIVPGTTAATSWYQGAVVSFTYDGTSWYMNDHITGISADAGSATNPVYFSEGQPKACTYSLNKTVPSGAVFTDTNDAVTQTATTTDANYEVLFSGTADDTTRTEGSGKSQYFKFNPSGRTLTVGNRKANTTVASYSCAIGYDVEASSAYTFATGSGTKATGTGDHAEGVSTTASGGYGCHAEGLSTTASGASSHGEGNSTTASGMYSHSEGNYTTANHKSQHVFGEYNIADPSTETASKRGNYVEIVGNGTKSSAKSNARTLDWSGNEWLAGTLTIGGTTSNATTVMSAGVGGTDNQTDAGTYFLSISGGGNGVPSLYLHNRGSNANTISVTAGDITLGGTSNTWDGTNTSLKSAITAAAAGGTDVNVTQTATTTNSAYEILFSGTADNTTRTEGARKTSSLTYNPSTSTLTVASSISAAHLDYGKFTLSNNSANSIQLDLATATFGVTVSHSGVGITYGNTDAVTTNGNTWDGTNTSLKSAITAIYNYIDNQITNALNTQY